jgi:hypothetical protein
MCHDSEPGLPGRIFIHMVWATNKEQQLLILVRAPLYTAPSEAGPASLDPKIETPQNCHLSKTESSRGSARTGRWCSQWRSVLCEHADLRENGASLAQFMPCWHCIVRNLRAGVAGSGCRGPRVHGSQQAAWSARAQWRAQISAF